MSESMNVLNYLRIVKPGLLGIFFLIALSTQLLGQETFPVNGTVNKQLVRTAMEHATVHVSATEFFHQLFCALFNLFFQFIKGNMRHIETTQIHRFIDNYFLILIRFFSCFDFYCLHAILF